VFYMPMYLFMLKKEFGIISLKCMTKEAFKEKP